MDKFDVDALSDGSVVLSTQEGDLIFVEAAMGDDPAVAAQRNELQKIADVMNWHRKEVETLKALGRALATEADMFACGEGGRDALEGAIHSMETAALTKDDIKGMPKSGKFRAAGEITRAWIDEASSLPSRGIGGVEVDAGATMGIKSDTLKP